MKAGHKDFLGQDLPHWQAQVAPAPSYLLITSFQVEEKDQSDLTPEQAKDLRLKGTNMTEGERRSIVNRITEERNRIEREEESKRRELEAALRLKDSLGCNSLSPGKDPDPDHTTTVTLRLCGREEVGRAEQ